MTRDIIRTIEAATAEVPTATPEKLQTILLWTREKFAQLNIHDEAYRPVQLLARSAASTLTELYAPQTGFRASMQRLLKKPKTIDPEAAESLTTG